MHPALRKGSLLLQKKPFSTLKKHTRPISFPAYGPEISYSIWSHDYVCRPIWSFRSCLSCFNVFSCFFCVLLTLCVVVFFSVTFYWFIQRVQFNKLLLTLLTMTSSWSETLRQIVGELTTMQSAVTTAESSRIHSPQPSIQMRGTNPVRII